jgi:hypothetical protein
MRYPMCDAAREQYKTKQNKTKKKSGKAQHENMAMSLVGR